MRLIFNCRSLFTKCLVLHPVSYPNKGPIVEQYLAEQAIGLASSLKWSIIEGPFWKEKEKHQIPNHNKRNEIYIETVDKNAKIENGTRVRTSIGTGLIYKEGMQFDNDESEDEDDLYQQWKNKNLRQSLANSSLIKVKRITQKFFFTKGKIDFLANYIRQHNIDCIFLNTELKPGQIRNLKKVIEARINDKSLPSGYGIGDDNSQTQLESEDREQNEEYKGIRIFDRFSIILQIFAQRCKNIVNEATTRISKLQIQLSFLNYLKTRLVRSGSTYSSNLNIFYGDLMKAKEINMEIISAKQRKAFQTMSGEGESQLQLQRRNIKSKQAKIRKEIDDENRLRKAKKEKEKGKKSHIPIIALVGYTNVGKSALMNKITKKSAVSSQDLLFETLKTTSRYVDLPSGCKVNLLDTIGFITNLPVQLVESFKTTLEEVAHADLIIHLRDISHPQHELQKQSVLKILKEIKFDQSFYNEKMIEVWNKIDLIEGKEMDAKEHKISCQTGEGVMDLLNFLDSQLKQLKGLKDYTLEFCFSKDQQVREWLKKNANISYNLNEEHDYEATKEYPNGKVKMVLQLEDTTFQKLRKFINPQQRKDKSRKGMPPPDW